VHRGQVAGLARLGAVLEFLEQGALGGRGGLGVGRHITHSAVMVAEVCFSPGP
jgi:hypothetical protein